MKDSITILYTIVESSRGSCSGRTSALYESTVDAFYEKVFRINNNERDKEIKRSCVRIPQILSTVDYIWVYDR